MTQQIHVGPVSAFEEGDCIIVDIGKRTIGVIRYDGNFYAIENECPHRGGPVCEGKVQGSLKAEWSGPGQRPIEYFDDDVPAVACPWHGWEFDLETGCHLGDGDIRIDTFTVVVDDGDVFIEVED